ncbi:MAG: ParB/RepB/Spo0J family partition protein, partial [Clostridiales bacterium]|nr:ParB/RepB/Spo0J family partition protein [Candidatus Equinaster intestinalis]
MKTGTLKTVSTEEIMPNPNQPRKFFDEYELSRLAESIRENGILQPLTVRKKGNVYELISGERRLRAARMAGHKRVPCIIINADENSSAVYAIIENLQREDLTFFEEAQAIERLITEHGLSHTDTAARLGIAGSTLSNKLRLLSLPEGERQRIVKAQLTERHARALLRLPEEKRTEALDHIIARALNLKETEKYIEGLVNPEPPPPKKVYKGAIGDLRLFSNSLDHLVQTLVSSGVNARFETKESKDFIEYKIKIPKAQTEGRQIKLKI